MSLDVKHHRSLSDYSEDFDEDDVSAYNEARLFLGEKYGTVRDFENEDQLEMEARDVIDEFEDYHSHCFEFLQNMGVLSAHTCKITHDDRAAANNFTITTTPL